MTHFIFDGGDDHVLLKRSRQKVNLERDFNLQNIFRAFWGVEEDEANKKNDLLKAF